VTVGIVVVLSVVMVMVAGVVEDVSVIVSPAT
jgi:hypothetical protein